MPLVTHVDLDLETLDTDPTPTFAIKTGQTALPFEILFCNKALRTLDLRNAILADHKEALLFRTWAQALGDYKCYHNFEGRQWSAVRAGSSHNWKLLRAMEVSPKVAPAREGDPPAEINATLNQTPMVGIDELREESGDEPGRSSTKSIQDLPRTNLSARWESIQTMMEMSDVGVFEYNPEGKLLHANEAWYRLRYACVENPFDKATCFDMSQFSS